jgi:pyruvate-formate lyase
MIPEERLDRLERIAKLMVRAGLRARREMRQQDDKITIMIDAQIKNEERFAKLAQAQTELAESQTHTDRRLDALIAIVKEGRNGKSR